MATNTKMLRLLRLSLISFLSSNNNNNRNHNRCTSLKLSSRNNNYYSTSHQQQQQQQQQHQHQQYDNNNNQGRTLNVALIGAGLLATGSHAPVLDQLSSSNIRCVAVWSRNFDNAESLASKLGNSQGNGAQVMPTDSFQEILNSPLIDAVILTTPIHVQSEMVLQALQAGKHVLSEKPLAVNMDQALALVEEYEAAFQDGLVWNVAGDYRYAPAVRMSHKAMEEIGKPFLVSLKVRAPFLKSSPVSEALWRNQNQWYGGMIVEAFVHASCMLKRLFGTPLCVSAHTSSQTPHIPSLDTMTAQVTWDQDVQGTVSVTYASTQHEMELEVIGSQGRMVLKRLYDGNAGGSSSTGSSIGGMNGNGYYRLSVENASTRYHQDIPFGGLDSDILAFTDSIRRSGAYRYNTPQDALQDLELVDACLESGKLDGARILLPPDMDPIHRQEYYQQGQSGGSGTGEEAINVDHLAEDTSEDMTASSPWGTRQRVYQNGGGNFMDDGRTRWHGKERL